MHVHDGHSVDALPSSQNYNEKNFMIIVWRIYTCSLRQEVFWRPKVAAAKIVDYIYLKPNHFVNNG